MVDKVAQQTKAQEVNVNQKDWFGRCEREGPTNHAEEILRKMNPNIFKIGDGDSGWNRLLQDITCAHSKLLLKNWWG